MMTAKTIFSFALLAACSSSPTGPNDASTDATSGDAAQEAAVVTCSTPGAACPGGGVCFFAVGDCTATMGICSDNSACAGAPTETLCHCDGSEAPSPQCGPGGYALVQASAYGPCPTDAGTD